MKATDTNTRSRWGLLCAASGIIGNVLLAVVTIAAAYGGSINPETTAIGALLAMLFPALLIITLIFCVINAIWWRKRCIINVVSLVVCASPIWTLCPLNMIRASEKTLSESDDVIKVMTFNVLDFTDYTKQPTSGDTAKCGNPTIDFILRQDADIVLCQEAGALYEPHPGMVANSDIASLYTKYAHIYASRRGMAILSKYPMERISVPVSDENAFDLCRYDVRVSDSVVVHVFNVHLQSLGLTSGDKAVYRGITQGDAPSGGMKELREGLLRKLSRAFKARAQQAREVRTAIDAVDGTVVLAGDFNDIPGSYASRIIEGDDMTDAYSHAGLGPAITYHADRLYFRIDQMYYRGNLEAERTVSPSFPSSDHYPLICYFKILNQ